MNCVVRNSIAAAVLAASAQHGHAQSERCASSFAEAGLLLGRIQVSHSWREVSMTDGKPLVLRIAPDGSGLRLSFVKSGEGLWAEGPVRICRRAARVQAEVGAAEWRLGPAAGWVMRQLLSAGAVFELELHGNGRLRVVTAGWSGDFESAD